MTLIVIVSLTGQLAAQTCSDAINLEPNVPFEMFEANRSAFATFYPTTDKVYVGLSPTTTAQPDAWLLYSGQNCNNLALVDSGTIFDPGDGFWYLTFSDLVPNTSYYLELANASGTGFTVGGLLTESVASNPNCPTAHQCNYFVSPGFENPDPNWPLPVGGSIVGGQPFWALVDEACGWERASTNSSCTPEYFLAPLDVSYGGPCAFPGQNGNSCTNFANNAAAPNNGGQGVIQLFTLDTRPNNPQPNRREYVFTEFANGFTQAPGIYAMRVFVRHDTERNTRCSSLQAAFVNNFTPVTHPNILNLGTPLVDLTQDIDINDPDWQIIWHLFEYTGPGATQMVIGNFESNANSTTLTVGTPTANSDFIPALYLDNFTLFELPNAGQDVTICDPTQVTLGYSPLCTNIGPVTISWTYVNTNTLLPNNTAVTQVTIPGPGVHTYRMSITYQGRTITDDVTVTVVPELATQTVSEDNCDGFAQFEIANLSDWANWNFASPNGSVSWTGNPTVSGNMVTFTNPVVPATNGIGTILGTVDFYFNGVLCTKDIELTVYECCRQFKTDYTLLPDGASLSTLIGTANVQVNNAIFTVYGNVTIDDDYTFDQCQFYMMPDAQLTIAPAVHVAFVNSSLQACGIFKWDRVLHTDAISTLIFDNCTVKDALRGLHTFNDAALTLNNTTFEDNVFAQIMENYTNAGATISWNNNTYTIYGPTHNTQQHPASTIVLTPWLGIQNIAVGIRGLNASDIVVAGQNTFWCDYATNPEGIQLWLTNNCNGTVEDNQFYNGHNIVLDNSSLGIFDNAFSKLAGTQGGPTGIRASQSTLTVGQGTQPGTFSNVLLDGAAIDVTNPLATTIRNNQIETYSAGYCINIEASNPTYSHTVVQHNVLKGQWGMRLVNLNTNWPAQPGPRVLINNNSIFARRVDNQPNTTAVGISATNCEGISIGNNQDIVLEYGNNVSFPNATNAHLTKGIWLNNCRNAFVGCNTIHFAGQGLSLEYDVSKGTWNTYNPPSSTYPPNFQVNNFASCYYGMYLAPICTMPLEIGASTLAADNTWNSSQYIGPNITTAARIKDDRNALHQSQINYFRSNLNQNTNPNPASSNIIVINLQSNYANNCTIAQPPSNKKESDSETTLDFEKLILYPNPVDDVLMFQLLTNYPSTDFELTVYNLYGQTVHSSIQGTFQGEIATAHLAPGVYVVRVSYSNREIVARFVKQ